VQLESEVPIEPTGTSQRPSNVLVPRLLALFSSPYEDAKCLSVSIMNLLAGGAPSAVADHMDRLAARRPCPFCLPHCNPSLYLHRYLKIELAASTSRTVDFRDTTVLCACVRSSAFFVGQVPGRPVCIGT
jgi:hypothetical protein